MGKYRKNKPIRSNTRKFFTTDGLKPSIQETADAACYEPQKALSRAAYNCQCAVLGGSIGLAPGYIPLVEGYLLQEPAVYHTPILAAHYQHDAGLIGAALLAEDTAL